MDEIVFLGTGGGRFATMTQWRATGGIRLNLRELNIHVDPGPGSLVRAKQFNQNPQNIGCVIVTHSHPDHFTEVAVMIEAMTRGMTQKKGCLVTSESVVNPIEDIGPVISKYHLGVPAEKHSLKPGDVVNVGTVKVTALKAVHGDPTTIGLKFEIGDKVLAYTSDTEYFDGIAKQYKGSDILIMNVMRPKADRIRYHLCSDDAIKILKAAQPKLCIITHFGMKMIQAAPIAEAAYIQQQSGVRTMSAEDGMIVSLEEGEQATLGKFK